MGFLPPAGSRGRSLGGGERGERDGRGRGEGREEVDRQWGGGGVGQVTERRSGKGERGMKGESRDIKPPHVFPLLTDRHTDGHTDR